MRQNLPRLLEHDPPEVLILSGDQLYLMNIAELRRRPTASASADLTDRGQAGRRARRPRASASCASTRRAASSSSSRSRRTDDAARRAWRSTSRRQAALGFPAPPGSLPRQHGHLRLPPRGAARAAGREHRRPTSASEVIPAGARPATGSSPIPYDGYWTDIGTIPSFHQANLDLTLPLPPLNLYDPDCPIYTHPRFLPGTKINELRRARARSSARGASSPAAEITDSIVGIRAVVRAGSVHRALGHHGREPLREPRRGGDHDPARASAATATIRNAIIDFNARIGDGCKLINADGIQDADDRELLDPRRHHRRAQERRAPARAR